jgi:hypothetical protein
VGEWVEGVQNFVIGVRGSEICVCVYSSGSLEHKQTERRSVDFLTLCLNMISLAMHAGGPDSLTGLPV